MVGLNGTWSDFVQFLHKFDATQCHALMNFEKTNSICYCCGGTLQNPIVALCEDKFSPVGPFSSLHRNPFLFLHVIVNVSQNRCAGHSITVGPVCPWTTLFTSVTAILHSQHRSVRKRPNLKKKKKIFCCGNCFHSSSSVWRIWLACACVTLSLTAAMGGSAPLMQILNPVSGVTLCTAQPMLNRRFYHTSTQSLLVLKCSLPLKYS